MGEYRKLWWVLIGILAVTFSILGFAGIEVYKQAPPIPVQVVTTSNQLLMTDDDILNGQTAWQSVQAHGADCIKAETECQFLPT